MLTDELIRASLAKAKAAGQKWAEGGEIDETELNEKDRKDSELTDTESNNGADRN